MKDRIKALRKTLKLTQKDFAERIGVRQNTVAQYEMGRNEPTGTVISLICREFNVNEDWLRTGSGEMFLPDQDNALAALADKYHLTPEAVVVIDKFIHLSAADQEAVIRYCRSVGEALAERTPKEFDIDAAVEDYRRQLLLEKEAKERSDPLQGIA